MQQAGVYLLGSHNDIIYYLKCGKTTNLQNRLHAYDTHNPIYEFIDFLPVPYNLLSTIEKQYQQQLKQLSLNTTTTEWFQVSALTFEHIKQKKLKGVLNMTTREEYLEDVTHSVDGKYYQLGNIADCIIYMYDLHIPNRNNFVKEVRNWLKTNAPQDMKRIYENAENRRNAKWSDNHPNEQVGAQGYRGWPIQFSEQEFKTIIQHAPSLRKGVTKPINKILLQEKSLKTISSTPAPAPVSLVMETIAKTEQVKSIEIPLKPEHSLSELQNIIHYLKTLPQNELTFIIDNLQIL